MAMYVGSLVGLLIILSFCFCYVKAAPAYFVFGDTLVESGNNNYIVTNARSDFYPYGIDYPTRTPTGRFANGLNIADFISKYYQDATTVQYFVQYKNRVAQILGVNETNSLVAKSLMSITLGGNDYVNNYYLIPASLRSIQYTLPDYTRFIVSEYEKYLRQLYNLGGRRVLVTSTGPLGCAPGVRATRSLNGECAIDLQKAASLFNSQLRSVINRLNKETSTQDLRIQRMHVVDKEDTME